ncbi:MAG: AAA family ATPase, partial [Bacteroidota bacterium]
MKQKLPIGLQHFDEIRRDNWLYVDKTQVIHRLVESGKFFFLSRPRRFGKSLTLSTLKFLFKGRKELFDGLWIQDHWDWSRHHPVVHISFSSIGYKTLGLEKAIHTMLDEQATVNGVKLTKEGFDQKFAELIVQLSKENQVVLLLDEYDKPLIDYLDDLPQARAHQKILKSFYSILKDAGDHIRFLLITGVSKFSKVSIFSELNNLEDLTIDRRFADLVGLTQQELEDNFADRIETSQQYLEMDEATLLASIKDWYNGYSWDGKTFVYNPFSILNFFQKSDFRNFW